MTYLKLAIGEEEKVQNKSEQDGWDALIHSLNCQKGSGILM